MVWPFYFRACAEVCVGSFVWRYRRNLSLKINYSCMCLKLCDGTTSLKVPYLFRPGYLLRRSVNTKCFTYSGKAYTNLLAFLSVTLIIMCVQTGLTYQIKGEIPVYLNIVVQNLFPLKENNNFGDES